MARDEGVGTGPTCQAFHHGPGSGPVFAPAAPPRRAVWPFSGAGPCVCCTVLTAPAVTDGADRLPDVTDRSPAGSPRVPAGPCRRPVTNPGDGMADQGGPFDHQVDALTSTDSSL